MQMLELVTHKLEGVKANIMKNISEVEQFMNSIEDKYFFVDEAPAWVAKTYMDSINALWSQHESIESYSVIPEFREFIETVEEEITKLVGRFQRWTKTRYLNTVEAGEKHGRSRSTVYRWIKSGKLQARKRNGRWFILA